SESSKYSCPTTLAFLAIPKYNTDRHRERLRNFLRSNCMSAKITGVTEFPLEITPVAEKPNEPIMVRTVIMLPEEGRAALRTVALEDGLDMGEVVFEALKENGRYREALERIRKRTREKRKE